jgi:hypothetical protein
MELESHMGNPSPHLQLRIPVLDKQSLSFCDANPQALTKWINSLPKANLGETARLLYQCLAELNQLQTPGSNRMRLMELLRPEVLFVCKHLEKHFLNQSVVLEERPRKVANLCQALQNHLGTGYKLIVVQEAESFRKEQTVQLTTAIERSLTSLFGPLVRSCQLYCPVPEGLWLEMHLLYQVACSFELQSLPITDPLSHFKAAQTVENTYLAALMLGCARTNQMRQNAIANLAEVMTAWSPLVRLEAADSSTTQFWIDPQQDEPPRLKSLFSENDKQALLGINPSQLLAAIEEYLQADKSQREQARLPVTDRLQPEQIQHLGAAWGDAAERAFRRMPSQGNINICIGMTSVHYYLAGEKAFGDALKNPVNAGNARFKNIKAGGADIWSRSFDAQPTAHLINGEPVEEIQYEGADAPVATFGGNSDNEKYPIYSLLLINHSPSGYRLSWPREVPGQLQAGELLGIQDPLKKSWNLAAVRWIRQVRGGGTQMGVELLAPSAQPCGLQLVRKADQSSQFLRALLLPEIKAISRPASLITPRLPFQVGNRVLVSLNGVERRATLDEKLSFTGSFSQFEFHYNQSASLDSLQIETGKSSSGDDFDSLWKSL